MNELRTERVRRGHGDLGRILALYERAFPENERRPLDALLDDETGAGSLIAFYDGGALVGFACVLDWRDISHIIYIAVEEGLRGRGYGARTIGRLCAMKPGCRVIADLEAVVPGAENAAERTRRMGFYQSLGFEQTQVRYRWRGEEYVILSRGGQISRDEFRQFWQEIERLNPAFSQY